MEYTSKQQGITLPIITSEWTTASFVTMKSQSTVQTIPVEY